MVFVTVGRVAVVGVTRTVAAVCVETLLISTPVGMAVVVAGLQAASSIARSTHKWRFEAAIIFDTFSLPLIILMLLCATRSAKYSRFDREFSTAHSLSGLSVCRVYLWTVYKVFLSHAMVSYWSANPPCRTGLNYPIVIFGRYCSASARCPVSIASLPAKSAIVRASLSTR